MYFVEFMLLSKNRDNENIYLNEKQQEDYDDTVALTWQYNSLVVAYHDCVYTIQPMPAMFVGDNEEDSGLVTMSDHRRLKFYAQKTLETLYTWRNL